MDWNDLRLFVLTARAGGLAAGARAAGTSPATLGRRLLALEADLGQALFDRLPGGYVLTEAGHDLLAEAEPVELAMAGLERRREERREARTLRLSAGTWTSRFLARHLRDLVAPGEDLRLALLATDERLDIARRAADIGIRARRPEEAWLAGRRVGTVAYAVYGVEDAPEGFIASAGGTTASAGWLRERARAQIAVETTSPRLVLDLARAGAGRAVLPCFVGDAEPALSRLGPLLPEIAVEQWLVMHHNGRHDPAVRRIVARLARLLKAHAPAFLGEGR